MNESSALLRKMTASNSLSPLKICTLLLNFMFVSERRGPPSPNVVILLINGTDQSQGRVTKSSFGKFFGLEILSLNLATKGLQCDKLQNL